MSFDALIVDDDPDHLQHLSAVLVALGARVSSASGRLQVLSALGRTPYDLVVWRTDLPELDGRHTLPQIRDAGQANAQSPYVAVVPDADQGEIRSYIRATFCAALPSPVQAWRLREIVFLLGLAERPLSPPLESLKVMDALSSELRLRLYAAVARRGQATSTVLGAEMGESRANAEHHLKALTAANLLVAEKRGRENWYSIHTQPTLQGVAHWMLDMADAAATYTPD